MPTHDETAAVNEIRGLTLQFIRLIRAASCRDNALTALAMALGEETAPPASIDKTLNTINGVARATAWTHHGTTE